MAKTTAVMTARGACRILDWVIKYLTIAEERLSKTKRPPVRAAAPAKGQNLGCGLRTARTGRSRRRPAVGRRLRAPAEPDEG